MAVLSSVTHPNIVSVYSCMTDMVEVEGAPRPPPPCPRPRNPPCSPSRADLLPCFHLA
jgi:hypothetical protein